MCHISNGNGDSVYADSSIYKINSNVNDTFYASKFASVNLNL